MVCNYAALPRKWTLKCLLSVPQLVSGLGLFTAKDFIITRQFAFSSPVLGANIIRKI